MFSVLASASLGDVLIAIAVPVNTLLLVILASVRTRDRHHLKAVREDSAASARIAKEAGAIIRGQTTTPPDETLVTGATEAVSKTARRQPWEGDHHAG